jgi:hypothetical protein
VRLPEGVTATNVRPGQPGYAVMDIAIDVPTMLRSMQKGFKRMGETMQTMTKAMRSFGSALRDAANDEIRVAGLEARYYVRGAFEDIDPLVRNLLRHPARTAPMSEAFALSMLTKKNRARLAAAAIRGHVSHTEGEAPATTGWCRWYRDAEVVVTVARHA